MREYTISTEVLRKVSRMVDDDSMFIDEINRRIEDELNNPEPGCNSTAVIRDCLASVPDGWTIHYKNYRYVMVQDDGNPYGITVDS